MTSQHAREAAARFFRDPACPVSVKMTLGYDPTPLLNALSQFEAEILERAAVTAEQEAERYLPYERVSPEMAGIGATGMAACARIAHAIRQLKDER